MKYFFCLFLLYFSLSAQIHDKRIVHSVDDILTKLSHGSSCSVLIYDPLSDDTIYARNIHKPHIPASNVKLFTSAALLHYFGNEFDVTTDFLTDDNNLADSIINGNLYIRGMGDPSLNTSDIDSIATVIFQTGLKEIRGDIIVDESVFDSIYTRDDWITNEKANVVLPPISGLIVNCSKIRAKIFRKNSSGNRVNYEVVPNYDFIDVSLRNSVINKRHSFESSLIEENNRIKLILRYNPSSNFRRKYFGKFVENPDIFFGLIVKAELELKGIKVTGNVIKGKVPHSTTKLTEISTPIEFLLNYTNKDSNNFFAECLFKLLGWMYSGESGNSFYATQSIMTYLDEIGVESENIDIVDGSGISRFNRLTTSSIVSLLTNIYLDDELLPVYFNSLSVAGIDGTLRNRFSSPGISQHFRGKTGTLNGVSSLSGFLTTSENKDLIVSILIEFNRNGANFYRAIQDEIVELLIGQ